MSNVAKVFVTLMFDDAVTILNQYNSQSSDNEALFSAAQEFVDSGCEDDDDVQIEMNVSLPMAEWLASMIRAENDESGIFKDILSSYNEKAGLNVK